MYVDVLKIEMCSLAEDNAKVQLIRMKSHSIALDLARGKMSFQPSPLYFAKTSSCTIIVLIVLSLD